MINIFSNIFLGKFSKKYFIFFILIFQNIFYNLSANSYQPTTFVHAFHLTKTEINFDEKNNALNITLHIFIDDLEHAVQGTNKEKLFIGTEKENKETDKAIDAYLNKKFSIEIGNKKINTVWVGKETAYDMQAIYVYLSAEKIKNVQQMHISNNLLTEIFSDQKNIVQVNFPNKPQGYVVFDKGKTNCDLKF